jgi:predicted nucleotidyltransferase
MNARYHTIVTQIKEAIRQTDPTATAILYGSRATGKARTDSDWDILILLNKPSVTLKEEKLFMHNLYDLELETGEPISTFVYSLQDWNTKLSVTPLYQTVKKEGIIL